MDLSILSGPIIGAVIGYGTNWVAIKMLFRPLKPVKIGKFTLPFTPGIIPKRKEKLANAIGKMVGNTLFTTIDIQKMLLEENLRDKIVASILKGVKCENTVKNVLENLASEEMYTNSRENLKLFISEKIKEGLINAGVGQIIANEGGKIVRNKVSGSMLKMFVTDGLIDSIVVPIGQEIEKYINEQGEEKIIPIVDGEMAKIEDTKIADLMERFNFTESDLENVIKQIYTDFVLNNVSGLLENLDISGVVEEKINKMEVLELEKLLLSIMKKELGAIVNLGALLGLILGCINIFV